MRFELTHYGDVPSRSRELNLNEPTGLALLPRNFLDAGGSSDLFHENSAQTIRILLRQKKIVETPIEKEGQKIPVIQENSFCLILPTLFVSVLILTGNPELVSSALKVMSEYATEFFKGKAGFQQVRMDVIVQSKNANSSKKIHYEGALEGLKQVAEIAGKGFRDDDQA